MRTGQMLSLFGLHRGLLENIRYVRNMQYYTTCPYFTGFDEWLIFFVTSSRHLDSDGSSAQVSWHIAKRCQNSDTQVISRYHQFKIMFGCPPSSSQYGFDIQNLVPEITQKSQPVAKGIVFEHPPHQHLRPSKEKSKRSPQCN